MDMTLEQCTEGYAKGYLDAATKHNRMFDELLRQRDDLRRATEAVLRVHAKDESRNCRGCSDGCQYNSPHPWPCPTVLTVWANTSSAMRDTIEFTPR